MDTWECEGKPLKGETDLVKQIKVYQEERNEGTQLTQGAAVTIGGDEREASAYHQFDEWVNRKGMRCPDALKEALYNHRQLFLDYLLPGLPPERVIDHIITLVPEKLPRKEAFYSINRKELEALQRTVKKLQAARWISMTFFPFAAPAMMVGKKDDKARNKQYRMRARPCQYELGSHKTANPNAPTTRGTCGVTFRGVGSKC